MIRASILLWLVLIAGSGGALYYLKYQVIALEERLAEVRGDIEANRSAIAMLHAEWSYLNDPAQIEAYAEQHLGTRPATVRDIVALADIPFAEGVTVRAPVDSGPGETPPPPAFAPDRQREPGALPPIAVEDDGDLLMAEAETTPVPAPELALVPAGQAAPPPSMAVAGPQDAIGALIANVLHEPATGALRASFPRGAGQ